MSDQKFSKLAAAMARVNEICNELQIPELISLDDQRKVLKAMDDGDLNSIQEFVESLGPKPLTDKIQ
jgi:hypothetical protein